MTATEASRYCHPCTTVMLLLIDMMMLMKTVAQVKVRIDVSKQEIGLTKVAEATGNVRQGPFLSYASIKSKCPIS